MVNIWLILMVIIWLMMVNNYLVGGFNHLEKYEFVSWGDDIPNMMENNPNVPNHQPDIINRDSWQKILSGY
jgi:hypothetical protein